MDIHKLNFDPWPLHHDITSAIYWKKGGYDLKVNILKNLTMKIAY